MKILLASGSPRRKELLAQAGYSFTAKATAADETVTETDPARRVEILAERKAEAAAKRHGPGSIPASEYGSGEPFIIIGADTIVVLDGTVLGKPADVDDAADMLKKLSGRTHQVYTGVALFLFKEGAAAVKKVFHECTDVTMRDISREEIKAYIATGEPLDKAGAYGIQGKAARFISGIHGDYYNVVGLPVCRLVQELESLEREYPEI